MNSPTISPTLITPEIASRTGLAPGRWLEPRDRDEWLWLRKGGLGASDVPSLFGLPGECPPWSTPLEIYHDKTTPTYCTEDNQAMRMGRLLEPLLASLYEEAAGVDLCEPRLRIRVHAQHDWLRASPDRFVASNSGGPGKWVELKNSGRRDGWGEPGTDEIPDHYKVQCQAQLACSGMDELDVAALLCGTDFRIYTVRRNEQVIKDIVEAAGLFWHEVIQARRRPAPDYEHPSTARILAHIYSVKEGHEIDLTSAEDDLLRHYLELKAQEKELGGRIDVLKNTLLDTIRENAVAHGRDGRILRRKLVKRKGYAVEPTEYYQLTAKQKEPSIVG